MCAKVELGGILLLLDVAKTSQVSVVVSKFDLVASEGIFRINMLFLTVQESEDLLAQVEVSLNGTCCDSKLRRRVANLI